MKKVDMIFAVMLAAFSLSAKTYSVKSVTGKVEYESKPGVFLQVKNDTILDDTSVVNTGLNSSLVLICKDNNKVVTIKPMKKGTISSIIKANGTSGVTIGSAIVTKSTITDEDTKTTKGVSTAASRASEAKSDVDWE